MKCELWRAFRTHTFGIGGSVSIMRHLLIDEIYVWPQDLAAARRRSGRLAVGMEGEFFKGSDHKLVWVELNW